MFINLKKRVYYLLSFVLITSTITACGSRETWEQLISPDPNLSNTSNPVQTSDSIPADFPDNIPIYPQVEVKEVASQLTPRSGKVIWESPDPSNLVENYYLQQFESNNWTIASITSENNITASKDDLTVIVSLQPRATVTEILLQYQRGSNSELNPADSPISQPVVITDVESLSPTFRQYIQDLALLGVFRESDWGEDQKFEPNQMITRRDYARWLFVANNLLYQDTPEKQVRLAAPTSKPAFDDVNSEDPDFPIIQALAETGLIPSPLNDSTMSANFRPDDDLTRGDLIAWKVPLDFRKPLPPTSIEDIRETWGFQDASKIDAYVLPKIYIDYQNSQPNITRAFGYSTLFLADKTVTRAEAAAVLWHFGFQDQGISAQKAISE